MEETIMPTKEVPLPDMPAVPTLWAVHVQGPDDIVAERSRETADQNAAALNDWYERRTKEPDFNPKVFPYIHAEVIEWPYSPQAHAEALAEQEAEGTGQVVDIAIRPDGAVAQ